MFDVKIVPATRTSLDRAFIDRVVLRIEQKKSEDLYQDAVTRSSSANASNAKTP